MNRWRLGYFSPQKKNSVYSLINNFKPIGRVKNKDCVIRCKFSNDGLFLASIDGLGYLHLLDVTTQREICSFLLSEDGLNDLSFDAGGHHLYIATGKRALCVEYSRQKAAIVGAAAVGSGVAAESGGSGVDLERSVLSVACPSIEGQYFLTGGFDEVIRKWDIRRFSCVSQVRAHDGAVSSLSLSHDDTVICSGGFDGMARLWAADSLDPLGTYGLSQGAGSRALSHASLDPATGQYLLTVPANTKKGEFPKLYSTADSSLQLNLVPPSPLEVPEEKEEFLPPLFRPVERSMETPFIGDTLIESLTQPGPFVFASFSPNGAVVAVPRNTTVATEGRKDLFGSVYLWCCEDGRLVARLSGSKAHRQCQVTSVDFNPKQTSLVATSGSQPDNGVVLWVNSALLEFN